MTETVPPELHEPAPSLPASFLVEKYRADGGVGIGNALQLVGILGLAGIVLGVVTHYVSQWFYLIVLFPILIGVAIGAIGAWCIKRFHIRHPLMGGLAGFVAGCFAMVASHYCDYQKFEGVFTEDPGLAMVRTFIQDAAAKGTDSPEFQEVTQGFDAIETQAFLVDSFPKYVDFAATQGVEINNNRGGGKGMNLGYIGTYIYWGVEILIVAVLAFGLMSGAADAPYCADCGQWKQPYLFDSLLNPERVARELGEGRVDRWEPGVIGNGPVASVTLHQCTECEEVGDVDVFVQQQTMNKKGEVASKMLTRVTYPASAAAALFESFSTGLSDGIEDPEEAGTKESEPS